MNSFSILCFSVAFLLFLFWLFFNNTVLKVYKRNLKKVVRSMDGIVDVEFYTVKGEKHTFVMAFALLDPTINPIRDHKKLMAVMNSFEKSAKILWGDNEIIEKSGKSTTLILTFIELNSARLISSKR